MARSLARSDAVLVVVFTLGVPLLCRYLFMKLLPDYALVAPARPRIVLPKKSRKAPLISLVSLAIRRVVLVLL